MKDGYAEGEIDDKYDFSTSDSEPEDAFYNNTRVYQINQKLLSDWNTNVYSYSTNLKTQLCNTNTTNYIDTSSTQTDFDASQIPPHFRDESTLMDISLAFIQKRPAQRSLFVNTTDNNYKGQ